jgi:HEXXH motif-containing protein
VDLPPPEEHLVESLARAVSQVPQRPDRLEALAALRIGAWDDEDRAAFAEATGLLERAWPEMLAELRIVVMQIALLRGFGVDGFTDVATHGAIYVNSARLRPHAESGLGGPVRLAEALVHEGAHNRCNAAALSTPFLADGGSRDEPVVQTPLRQDPRPLTGLLQQIVVLVRSLMLYDRLLDAGMAEPALVNRREKLRGQAGEALRVVSAHGGRLTDHGRSVVAHARDLHARSFAIAAPAT